MRSDQEFQRILTEFSGLLSEMRDQDLTLDDLLEKVAKGLGLYREFKKGFSEESFDVRLVTGGAFDWKALGS